MNKVIEVKEFINVWREDGKYTAHQQKIVIVPYRHLYDNTIDYFVGVEDTTQLDEKESKLFMIENGENIINNFISFIQNKINEHYCIYELLELFQEKNINGVPVIDTKELLNENTVYCNLATWQELQLMMYFDDILIDPCMALQLETYFNKEKFFDDLFCEFNGELLPCGHVVEYGN